MKRLIAAAVVLPVWLGMTEPVSAQSALKRLEELIRSQRSGAIREAPAAPGQIAGQAPRQPTDHVGPASAREPGYLGVVADDRQDRGHGVRILEVRPASPADIAGLKAQDLVTSLGGIRVRQMDDLAAILDEVRPGDVLEFDLLRGDVPRKVEVTFGRRARPKPGSFEELVTPSPEPLGKPPGSPKLDLPKPPAAPPPLPPANARPADAPPNDQALIQRLQRRVEALERRVQSLERALRERQ